MKNVESVVPDRSCALCGLPFRPIRQKQKFCSGGRCRGKNGAHAARLRVRKAAVFDRLAELVGNGGWNEGVALLRRYSSFRRSDELMALEEAENWLAGNPPADLEKGAERAGDE